MAITATLGFTNSTASTYKWTPYVIDTATKYAVVTDDPGKCVLKNTTSPVDQQEVLTYMCTDLKTINQEEPNVNPPKVGGGRLVTAKLEEKLRLTSSTDDTFCVDLPISASLSVRFAKSQYVTPAIIQEVVNRLIGALQDDSNSGALRWANLMVEQLNPNN